jgi:hypothetical protein
MGTKSKNKNGMKDNGTMDAKKARAGTPDACKTKPKRARRLAKSQQNTRKFGKFKKSTHLFVAALTSPLAVGVAPDCVCVCVRVKVTTPPFELVETDRIWLMLALVVLVELGGGLLVEDGRVLLGLILKLDGKETLVSEVGKLEVVEGGKDAVVVVLEEVVVDVVVVEEMADDGESEIADAL